MRPDFPGVELGLTGLPALETDEMVAAQSDTQLSSWLALGGVCLLFVLVYRGFSYPALTVVTLLTGTAWAMGWATLTVGHLNILSATFAVMLIGVGDYGVLWVMRYEQARRQGRQSDEHGDRDEVELVDHGRLPMAARSMPASEGGRGADWSATRGGHGRRRRGALARRRMRISSGRPLSDRRADRIRLSSEAHEHAGRWSREPGARRDTGGARC